MALLWLAFDMEEQTTQYSFGTPQPITAALYLVATPIGNLRDITIRALDVLSQADEVYCEDTRVTTKLLNAYGIKAKLSVYNDHSTDDVRAKIISKIKDGKTIALVSDAGMPLISDPGYKLVRDCLSDNISVTSLPGANAVLAAVQLSGLPSDTFTFHGFLPAKSAARQSYLKKWKTADSVSVIYESGKRLSKTLADIYAVFGSIDIVVARELTKKFEEIKTGTIKDLIAHYEESEAPKGEIVIVVAPAKKEEISEDEIDTMILSALKTMSVKEVSVSISEKTGKPKKEIYNRALEIKS